MGNVYGYAGVSSKDQNLDRQLDAFEALGVAPEMVFADKASGKDFERPECRRLIGLLAEGDVLVVFHKTKVSGWDCGGNLGPNSSYAARPKSLRYCMGLL